MLALIAEMDAEIHKILAVVAAVAALIYSVGIKIAKLNVLIGAVEGRTLAVDADDDLLFILGYELDGRKIRFKGRNESVQIALMEGLLKEAIALDSLATHLKFFL